MITEKQRNREGQGKLIIGIGELASMREHENIQQNTTK